MEGFIMKKINIAEQSFNPFELIGKDWMLISAGTAEKWNTMTASWGGVGVMWGKPSDRSEGRLPRRAQPSRLEVRPRHG